jgi:hypothetical protein
MTCNALIEQNISGFPLKGDLRRFPGLGGPKVRGDGRLRSGEGASLLPEPKKQMSNKEDGRRDHGNGKENNEPVEGPRRMEKLLHNSPHFRPRPQTRSALSDQKQAHDLYHTRHHDGASEE